MKKFEREVRKNTITAIVAAFGFIVALTWKDVIIEYMDKITGLSPIQGKLISAFVITIIAVIAIILISKLIPPE